MLLSNTLHLTLVAKQLAEEAGREDVLWDFDLSLTSVAYLLLFFLFASDWSCTVKLNYVLSVVLCVLWHYKDWKQATSEISQCVFELKSFKPNIDCCKHVFQNVSTISYSTCKLSEHKSWVAYLVRCCSSDFIELFIVISCHFCSSKQAWVELIGWSLISIFLGSLKLLH